MDKTVKYPFVSVLLTTFNDEKTILLTLESIRNGIQQYVKKSGIAEVIIINDASTDTTSKILESWINDGDIDVKQFYNSENMGVTKSLKFGFDNVNSNSSFIIRIDGDAFFINNNWILEFVETIQLSTKVGCVGSTVIYPNNIIQTAGIDFGNINKKKSIFISHGKLYKKSKIENSLVEVFAVSGTCACYRRECWNIDTNYFRWTEDIDQAVTVRKNNYKVFVLRNQILIHATKGYFRKERVSEIDLEKLSLISMYYLLRINLKNIIFYLLGERWTNVFINFLKTNNISKTNPLRKDQLLAENNNIYFKSKWGFNEFEFDSKVFNERYKNTEMCWNTDSKSQQLTKEIIKKYIQMKNENSSSN